MLTRRGVMAAGGAAAWLGRAGAWAAEAAPHSLDDFFRPAVTRDAALSPNGQRIAVLVEQGQGDDRRALVQIIDAADPSKTQRQVTVGAGAIEVEYVEWANDDRLLVVFTREFGSRTRVGTGSHLGGARSFEYRLRRVAALDADGSNPVILFENKGDILRSNYDLAGIVDTLPEDPANVLMVALDPYTAVLGLHRVDVNTGAARLVERGGPGTFDYHIHKGVPVLRFDAERGGSVQAIRARAPGERTWRYVQRSRRDQSPDFFVVSGTEDPDVLIVGARAEGEDVVSVRELNVRTLAFGRPMSQRPNRDAVGAVLDERRNLIATKYYDHRTTYDFSEKALAPHFRAMDRFFDNEANIHLFDVDDTHTRFLARVSGPREPGAYFLYDKAAKRLETLGSAYPGLDPARLGKMEALRVKTRDGAEIDAYLTAPPSGRPGPLVVLVHGGPESRDRMDWDRQCQVLAAQGWWVLQPNFRGSGGYGRAFAQAGWRRWGERMQEDVEDAAAHAIAAKKLDGKRVAIMGSSYGGYAALMGAVRRPELYKAAVSICGVTDLPEMLSWEKRLDDGPDQYAYKFWTQRIGDPKADGPRLERASPRRRAAEISAPVILVHGVNDRVVPIEQSRIMNQALKRAGKRVQLHEVKDAGHADWEDDVERELMARYVGLFREAFKA